MHLRTRPPTGSRQKAEDLLLFPPFPFASLEVFWLSLVCVFWWGGFCGLLGGGGGGGGNEAKSKSKVKMK